jgi:DNA-binding transcriptional regulator LsrR (DeoR family)
MSRSDELRLMVKVARMYYMQGITQQEITERLGIHQSTISRLLKRARQTNVVRFSVTVPSSTYPEIEEALEATFDLREAIVVECAQDEEHMVNDLGAAAAFFVESTVKKNEVIGISSWSAALLAMVESLHPNQSGTGGKVVQILGGVGNPGTPSHATYLTQRFAELISATPVLLPAPGVVGSPEAKKVLLRDPHVQQAVALFNQIDVALVGIGSLEPSKLLTVSGNVFSPRELSSLKRQGAIGDICLRFFDVQGLPVHSPLNDRVIGMELNSLKRVHRVVGVAGGPRKHAAILAALRGRWINVLITDRHTADRLLLEERQPSKNNGQGVPPVGNARKKA